MSCQGCQQNAPQVFTGYFQNSPCNSSCTDCQMADAACVAYTGSPLPCSGISTNDSIEVALQKIDEKICAISGDYSGYTFNCLTEWVGHSITTEGEFVDAITGYACQITTALNAFITDVYGAFVDATNTAIDGLQNPNFTCASAGINPVDNISLVLQKICSKFGDIDALFDVSSIVFDNCLTVINFPTNLTEALQLLADQICEVRTNGTVGGLPTFDNIGTCLDDPHSDDSLEDTILKIRTRLCLTPTWDGSPLNWYCVEEPSDPTDLGTGIQNILTQIRNVTYQMPTFSGDFVVTAVNPLNACAGVNIALAVPLNQDRFVAATAGDSSPGTLQTKLIPGTGVTLDFSTPTQVTINTTGGTGDHKVKANTADGSPDYLDAKLDGTTSNGVTISPSYNGGTGKVDLLLDVDAATLFDVLLDELTTNSVLYAKFCERVTNCPSSCDPPTNVQAIPGSSPTTSTTTLP